LIIRLHKNFKKRYQKFNKSQKNKFKERRNLFLRDEFDPILNNHALGGKYTGYRSINITGDIRVLYKRSFSADMGERDVAIFVTIDSHSNLYG